jgi:AcrR family transcriptional regulator
VAARPANPQLANDILRVTADLVEEKGAEKLALLEVARRLGYTRPTIYLYYKNKDELLQATIDRAFESFADVQDAAEEGCPPASALRRRVAAYLDWGIEHPGMYRLMFEHPAEKPVDAARAASRRRWLDRDRELLARVFEGLPEEHRSALGFVDTGLWGIAHGLVSLIISGRMFGQLGRAIGVDEAKARAQQTMQGILVLPADEEVEQ